jgi:hypothetical protein
VTRRLLLWMFNTHSPVITMSNHRVRQLADITSGSIRRQALELPERADH